MKPTCIRAWLVGLLLWPIAAIAQDDLTLENMVSMPTSPEAAAFAKYGATPISLFSGTPEISIPLANIQGRSLTVPISMTYDASGIKVEQVATNLGLGWNLNVGGVITRQVNGLADDYQLSPEYWPFYSESTNHPLTEFPDGTTFKEYYELFLGNEPLVVDTETQAKAYGKFIEAQSAQKVDTQPDTYRFSALGLSGTLWVDYETETGICIEKPDLKVSIFFDNPSLGGNKQILGWTIVDDKGTTYEFDKIEQTTFYEDQVVATEERTYISAWYLTSVATANSRDVIAFNYSAAQAWTNLQPYTNVEALNDLGTEWGKCSKPQSSSFSAAPKYKISQFDLTGITVNGKSRATFHYDDTRTDIVGKSRLKKIVLLDLDGKSVNEVDFHNDEYFSNGSESSEVTHRLKLDSISFVGTNGAGRTDTNLRQTWAFEYYGNDGQDMPPRDSFAQDFWGYYNGQTGNNSKGFGNGTLIPANATFDTGGFQGANRQPSINHAKVGTISKIYYPTGGHTEYLFQSNYVTVKNNAGSGATVGTVLKTKAYASLDGAEDTQDPAGVMSCGLLDDNTQVVNPALYKAGFSIEDSGVYDLTVRANHEAGQLGSDWYLIIYQGEERSLCSFIEGFVHSDPDVLYYAGGLTATSHEEGLSIYLEEGINYNMLLVSNGPNIDAHIARYELITYGTNNGGYEQQIVAGGLRTYGIIDRPDNSTEAQSRYFYYDQLRKKDSGVLSQGFFQHSTASSGLLQVPLSFESAMPSTSLDREKGVYYTCDFVKRSSSNAYRGQPAIVTYSTVTEVSLDGSQSNGFTVYEFYNQSKASIRPNTYSSGKNGKPKKVTIYDAQYVRLQETEYEWATEGLRGTGGFYLKGYESGDFDLRWTKPASQYLVNYVPMEISFFGFTVDNAASFTTTLCHDNDCVQLGPLTKYRQVVYGIGEYWLKLVGEKTTSFDGGVARTTTTRHVYDDSETGNFNLLFTDAIDSKGDTLRTSFEYPRDLAAGNNVYQTMVDANRVSDVIRTKGTRLNVTEKVLYEQETLYKVDPYNSHILPDSIKQSRQGTPLEARIAYREFDHKDNPVWLVKDGIQNILYQWDYNNSLAVAQLSGMKEFSSESTLAEDVFAFSNFDTPNKGGWTYNAQTVDGGPPWSQKYYNLASGAISKTISQDETYVVSFWANSTSGSTINISGTSGISLTGGADWTYHEIEVRGLTSLSISSTSALIDELRMYPKGMQMTTYAYDQAKRITAQMGPNGMPAYYKYDALGRPTQVLDHEGNILKLIDYAHKSIINTQD